jgi:hypothetical protein
MAPAPSKHAIPVTEITGPRKRKASSKITDENFVGAESNIVTKRLKLSADAARAAAAAAIDNSEDSDTTVPWKRVPKNAHAVLEAADDVEVDDVEVDNDPGSPFEEFDMDEGNELKDEVEVHRPETAEEQRSESKHSK